VWSSERHLDRCSREPATGSSDVDSVVVEGSMRMVIAGNGVAGITAARTLAQTGNFEIEVYSDESYHFYYRPRLLEVVSGESRPDQVLAYPADWYSDKGIDVRLSTRVAALDTKGKRVVLQGGELVPYDKLLLAIGGEASVPPIDGFGKPGTFVLRSMLDAIAVNEYAGRSASAVVVGGGLLGLETAAALRALNLRVTVIEIFSRLLPKQLDEQGSKILGNIIEQKGINIVLGASVQSILGDRAVTAVRTGDGQSIEGELVLVSTGVRPEKHIAEAAGISVSRGVIIDSNLRTSAPSVYAAGDVAEFDGRVFGIIPAAMEQGRLAALNMMEEGASVYRGTVPYTTLKVAGIDLTSIGEVNPQETGYEELRKSGPEAGIYKKIVLRDDRAVGAIVLGEKRYAVNVSEAVKRQAKVGEHRKRVLDDDFDFGRLG